MIGTIVNVVRGEGLASAVRRASERIEEAARHAALRARGAFARVPRIGLLNVSASSVAPRTGGVAIQLMARLRAERALREVALLHPGGLELPRQIRSATTIDDALALTGAKAVHLEGTSGAPIAKMLALIDAGIAVVVSVHDFTLWDEPLAQSLLGRARGVIFPSDFLLNRYRERFAFKGIVIEPAVPAADRPPAIAGERRGIAFAGNVRQHKGGHLLPELARRLSTTLHVFGGGDVEILRALRAIPNAVIHGYYRSGALPALLARHGIGLVVLPSIVEESYSITLSEAWLAGAAVAAFDLGAPAERIRRDGGGRLAPLESGVDGLLRIIEAWKTNDAVPRVTATPDAAARAHVESYRRWGVL